MKITPDAPENDSGLSLLIMMGMSICQKWVKFKIPMQTSRRKETERTIQGINH